LTKNVYDMRISKPEQEHNPIYIGGANWMLDQIRQSLRNYPNGGGDIFIMQEVDRICQEYYNAREKEKWMKEFNKNLIKEIS